jgi:hypothetical protein
MPVAIRMTISDRGIPSVCRILRMGRRSSWFGTGRVTSLTTMQALFFPRAISASGEEKIGS